MGVSLPTIKEERAVSDIPDYSQIPGGSFDLCDNINKSVPFI